MDKDYIDDRNNLLCLQILKIKTNFIFEKWMIMRRKQVNDQPCARTTPFFLILIK